MSYESSVKKIKQLAVVFGFSALGLAGGAISTMFNKPFSEYMEQATKNNPALLDIESDYHQEYYTAFEASKLRTADNLKKTGTGLLAGLGTGLLIVGAGAGISAIRRKPS